MPLSTVSVPRQCPLIRRRSTMCVLDAAWLLRMSDLRAGGMQRGEGSAAGRGRPGAAPAGPAPRAAGAERSRAERKNRSGADERGRVHVVLRNSL